MPLSRVAKKVKVETLAGELASSTSAIIGTFAGLTASKDFELRKTVRAAGGSYHVVNNKLAAKASTGTKIEAALQGLKGVSSVAYTAGDPVALAKALSAWVKDNAEFTFKLGIVDGKVITVQEIGALATMPGKEELFSKLLFLIQSPAQRLATVINATGRDLAVVINQAVEKEKFSRQASAPVAQAVPVESSTLVESSTPVAEPTSVVAAVPAVEASPVVEPVLAESSTAAIPESPVEEASIADASLVAEAHVAESSAAESESAQPENGTASQAGEAATTDPVEG